MLLLKACFMAACFAKAAELSDLQSLVAEVRALRQEVASSKERLEAQEKHEAEMMRRLQASSYVSQAAFDAQTKIQTKRMDELAAKSIGHDGAMDSMWLLLCGTLVMFMHAGFAMLETGCCRAKNAQNVLMKNMVNVCVGTLGWWIFGWAFAYGSSDSGEPAGGFIGVREFAATGFLTFTDSEIVPENGKPLSWFFQWAFCTAGATIVSGGVAERVKSPSYALFAFFMAGFIYPVVVAWTWGYGWLSTFNDVGYMDFAGSGIVHLSGGAAALAGTVVLGPRTGRWEKPADFEPHSLPLVVLGTFALWFGWYGFNPGSTLAMHDAETGALAAQIAMNTTLSAATGGITVFLFRYALLHKYDIGGLCNGILAGLVSITAGCGNVESYSACFIGLIGAFVYQGASMALVKAGVDDPVDAVPVHGACGIWACFAAALFDWGKGMDHYHAWSGWSCVQNAEGTGCMEGANGKGLLANLVLVLCVMLWSGAWATLAFAGLKMTGLLRVSVEVEEVGIDTASHSPSKAYSLGDSSNNNDGGNKDEAFQVISA